MQVQLFWTDPTTSSEQQPLLETPIALGGDLSALPSILNGQPVSHIILKHPQIAAYHALIDVRDRRLMIFDQNIRSATLINGVRLTSVELRASDRLQIGPYDIQVRIASPGSPEGCNRRVGFLLPRRCGRSSPVGCPDCDAGQRQSEPDYYGERYFYRDFGDYSPGHWGSHYTSGTESAVDFTDADGASLENPDLDFEQDMGAS